MRDILLNYWVSLWRDIPFYVYEIGGVVFFIGVGLCLLRFGIKKGLRFSAGLLLIEYVGLIYCSTVLFRETYTLQYNYMPLWSYLSFFRGEDDRLLAENIMNVVVFIPIGLLAGISFRQLSWKRSFVIGFCLSVGIEILQFMMSRGFSEVDDVMHNTLGCLIGYGLFYLIRLGYKRSLRIEKQKKKGHYFGYSIE